MPRKWRTALRKDGSGLVHLWGCGAKRYQEDGECDAVFLNPPKEAKSSLR